jgi:hypothetical protein
MEICKSWAGKLSISKISVLLKLIHGFNVIPIKVSVDFQKETDKEIQKLISNDKILRITKIILQSKNNIGGFVVSNFHTYNKAVVNKRL